MESPKPLALPPPARAASIRPKIIVSLVIPLAIIMVALVILRSTGLVRSFSISTGSMSPAVCAGDHFLTEDFTFLNREPRRGDIVTFKSDGISLLSPATLYIKRIIGEPGDHLRLADGKLFINNQPVSLSNCVGRISYDLPPSYISSQSMITNLTVPAGTYFVVGDNSTTSLDSRFWGSLPRTNITGRVAFNYWPPKRMGFVK